MAAPQPLPRSQSTHAALTGHATPGPDSCIVGDRCARIRDASTQKTSATRAGQGGSAPREDVNARRLGRRFRRSSRHLKACSNQADGRACRRPNAHGRQARPPLAGAADACSACKHRRERHRTGTLGAARRAGGADMGCGPTPSACLPSTRPQPAKPKIKTTVPATS
eukprot:162858-Chlamydomonas_euryale.AAC.7